MEHPGFFDRAGPFPLRVLAEKLGVTVPGGHDPERPISAINTLADGGPKELGFLSNRKYAGQATVTRLGACLIVPELAASLPAGCVPLVTKAPYHVYAQALMVLYPGARFSRTAEVTAADGPVHPSAVLEEGAVVETGAVVGREARIGRGTRVAAGAVVGYRVCVGRDSYIGPNVTLTHALVGDRVIIHAGVQIGQDGFGFAMGPKGHLKVPQIGRVVIQDDVEIGANSTIDRGALKDTIIGEGTKIDNLVQIGHNVVMGRGCIIVAQTGIAGSAELGDFVVMGGHSGIVGHVKVGSGTQIAGGAHVSEDLPPGSKVGGTPAVPFRDWARQIAALKRLAKRGGGGSVD